MCLFPDMFQETKFKKNKGKQRWVEGWKVLKISGKTIITPYQSKQINAGWFKAETHLASYYIENFNKNILYSDVETSIFGSCRPFKINEGIHFCRTRKHARRLKGDYSSRVIVRCKALVKDVFGLGDNDIVASKIWIDKAEIDKVKSKITRYYQ